MKRFVPQGPSLPFEVLRAQEEERLVFFCGAGISRYTGLPDFRDLVRDTFAATGIPLAEHKKDVAKPWDQAFLDGRFDQSLNLLEKEIGAPVMRRHIMDRLDKAPPGALALHKALLDLARTESGAIRLVTTNFDDRFERADPELKLVQAGPRIGPPIGESWTRLTYLHGRIDTADPDGADLVVTSGDFGRAYLRDGWAARFVVELFREFTVLFVGYSLGDPVVGYLIDALAADMRPDGQFRNAFVFAGHGPRTGDRKRVEDEWRAKGVEPILFPIFPRRRRPYALQDRTLEEWARLHRGGIGSRLDLALSTTRSPYLPGAGADEVRSLAWALSKLDGSVAQAFARATPSPHVSWIEPLSEEKIDLEPGADPVCLFDLPSPRPENNGILGHHLAPLAGPGATCLPGLPLHPVTSNLGAWLANHMCTPEVVDWVIERKGIVHPSWARVLADSLDSVASPVLRNFWRLILDGSTLPPCKPPSFFSQRWYRLHRGMLNPEDRALLLACARSYLEPGKPYRVSLSPWRTDPDNAGLPRALSDVLDFKLKLVDPDALRRLAGNGIEGEAQRVLAGLADDLTTSLADGVRLAIRGEVASFAHHSYISIPKIGGDNKMHAFRNSKLLVELCNTAFSAALEHVPEMADAVLRRWKALWRIERLDIFKRLTMHVYSVHKVLPARDGLAFAREEQGRVFWAHDAWQEVAWFLRLRANDLEAAEREAIAQFTAEGPTEGLFRGKPENLEAWRSHVVTERAGKLLQAGIPVPDSIRVQAEAYIHHQGTDRLESGEDETRFRLAHSGWVSPETADDILNLSPEEAAVAISSTEDDWQAGHKFEDLAVKKLLSALDTAEILVRHGDLRGSLWGIGTGGFSRAEQPEEREEVIQRWTNTALAVPTWFESVGARSSADLLAAYAPKMSIGEEARSGFWRLWDLAWKAVEISGESALEEGEDRLEEALNAPGGILASAVLDRLGACRPKEDEGLPEEIRPRFDRLASGETESHSYARIMLASRLVWLHTIDRGWSNTNIIRYMTPDKHDAMAMWQGFLWSGRWNPDLLGDMKDAFLSCSASLPEATQEFRSRFAEFFADILIVSPATLDKKSVLSVFAQLESSDLAGMVWYFRGRLEGAGRQAPNLWRETIGPVFADFWPASNAKKDPETSTAYAIMLEYTREAFPEALETLQRKGLITPSRELGTLGVSLDSEGTRETRSRTADVETTYDYILHHPKEMLSLLNDLVADDLESWHRSALAGIVQRIVNALPESLDGNPALQRLKKITGEFGQ